MSKLKYWYAVVLILNLPNAVASDWQVNQRGIEYQITSMSDSDRSKSQQAIETWQRQTADLFYQLNKLDIDYSTFEYQQKSFERISFGIVYSYDAANGSKNGVPISAVSPGGLMQKAGLKNGDIITAINGVSLENELQSNKKMQWTAAVSLTRELKKLNTDERFVVDIVRHEEPRKLHGQITTLRMPGLLLTATEVFDSDSSCGYLKTRYNPNRQSQLYQVEILSINQKRKRNNHRVKLSPGEYQIEVKELIRNRRLSNNISINYRKKTISLTVEENKQYIISAYLNEELINDRENYWHPEITEEDMRCEE